MEVTYRFSDDFSMEDVVFEGLSGLEYVTSTKDALNVMKLRNPAVDFSRNAKEGVYDELSDDEYQQALDTIKCISDLWRYPGESGEDSAKYEMNVLSLLANAIELISRQDVELRRYREEEELTAF